MTVYDHLMRLALRRDFRSLDRLAQSDKLSLHGLVVINFPSNTSSSVYDMGSGTLFDDSGVVPYTSFRAESLGMGYIVANFEPCRLTLSWGDRMNDCSRDIFRLEETELEGHLGRVAGAPIRSLRSHEWDSDGISVRVNGGRSYDRRDIVTVEGVYNVHGAIGMVAFGAYLAALRLNLRARELSGAPVVISTRSAQITNEFGVVI